MSFVTKSAGALHLALLRVLRSNVCPTCGLDKEAKKPFCKSCYFAVQKPLRNLLFTALDVSEGEFEENYLKAMRDMKRRNLTRPPKEWSATAQRVYQATGLAEALKAIEEEERAHHA